MHTLVILAYTSLEKKSDISTIHAGRTHLLFVPLFTHITQSLTLHLGFAAEFPPCHIPSSLRL